MDAAAEQGVQAGQSREADRQRQQAPHASETRTNLSLMLANLSLGLQMAMLWGCSQGPGRLALRVSSPA